MHMRNHMNYSKLRTHEIDCELYEDNSHDVNFAVYALLTL